MSRSTARKCLAPGTTVGRREVLVPTEIGDPTRGMLPCPAAPLVGGMLERRGIGVRFGPVPQCADASQADDGAVIFMTSTLHSDGAGTAIGAAASPVDSMALAAASAVVEEWSAVVATRRLVTGGSPWCDGARQAMERAQKAVATSSTPVYILGHLAGTWQARDELAEAGAIVATSLAEIPDGGTVFIPAHGVTPAVLAEAAGRNLEVIDATCPLVAGVHQEARRFAERGDQVVLIGHQSHPVVAGIAGHAQGRLTVAESSAGAASAAADPRRISYLLQPGIPVEDAAQVMAALRSRFPALHSPDPDRFCYAASDRAETVRAVASTCDVVLVLGDGDDPDTRQVTALVRDGRAKVHVISAAGQIVPSWLAGTTAIGLAEAASAAPGLAGEVTAALSGLGQLSVTRRQVSTQITTPAQGG